MSLEHVTKKFLWPLLGLVLWGVPLRADLVSYWPFDGNADALIGTSGVIEGNVAGTFDRNFGINGALSFDGASSVSVPGGGGLDGATVATISMWVQWLGLQNPACCNSFGNILSRQANGAFSDNILGLNGTDPATATLTWQQASSGLPLITGMTPVGSDWAHVAVTYSPFGSKLYLNGALQGEGIGPALHANPAIPLTIGAWGGDGAGFATANIDDVAIFNDYLSPEQIANLASGAATPLTVGPGGPGPMPPAPAITVAQAYASSQFSGRPPTATIDGSGLAADLSHVANPPSTMWLSAQNDAAPFIAYDLGSEHALESVQIWNYNETANASCCLNRGIADANILVAREDGVFYPIVANAALTIAPGTATNFSQSIPLSNFPARYVVIQSNANHGDAFTGLSEVRFNGTALSSSPAEYLPATIHSASSSLGDADGTAFTRFASNLVNDSGVFAGWHSVVPDGNMWLNRGSFVANLPADLEPEVTFDLGSVQALDHVKIWNYNESLVGREDLLNRGVQDFEILIAGDDLNFISLGTYTLQKAPGRTFLDFAENIDLGGVEARYVKFDIISGYGGDNNFVGLSEVRFFGVVPEPSSGALLAMVVGMLGIWRRRIP